MIELKIVPKIMLSGALLLSGVTYADWVKVNSAYPNRGTLKIEKSFASGANAMSLQFSAGAFEAENLGSVSRLNMEGAYRLKERGRPELPVYRYEIEVPSSKVVLKVRAKNTELFQAQNVALKNALELSTGPVVKQPGALEVAQASMDLSFHSHNEFYPKHVAEIVSRGSVSGREMITVEFRPLQYNPVTREIRFNDRVDMEIVSIGSSAVPLKQTESAKSSLDKALFQSLSYSSLGNPGDSMIVIVADRFMDHVKLQQYLGMKASSGLRIEKVAVSQAGQTDVALREYLRTKYLSSPFTFVMFVGDVELVPTHDAGAEFTDNYFAALDKPTYAEDKTYPDVSVGRLAVKDANELDTVMNKHLKYQGARFPNTDWIKKIAFLATDDRYTVAEGTHNYVINSYTSPQSYSGNFPTETEVGGDKLYAITHRARQNHVQRSMNEGRAIISYSGHGATTYWDAPRVTREDVYALPPTDAFPYVMSHACISGSYGMNGDSFGEMWLKAPNGGIGFWGTSNNSYWDEDDILEKVFFDGMFRDQIASVGQLNQFALAGVRQAFGSSTMVPYYYSIYNLLGDPSIEIFKSRPAQNENSVFAQILDF